MAAIITLAEYKALIGTTSTANDTRIGLIIPIVQADVIDFCNYGFGTDQDPVVDLWPAWMKGVAVKMINCQLVSLLQGQGKKSESLEGYSYTKEDIGASGYPASIESALRKARRLSVKIVPPKTVYRDRRAWLLGQAAIEDPLYSAPGILLESADE
jgi:hypothetical protein